MDRLTDAAREIVSFLQAQAWSCCIVGGMAVPRWGEPRATADVDICLFTGFGDEASFIEPILQQFAPRIDDAGDFAARNRVLLVAAPNGIGIDVALAWTPFEASMLARATLHQFTTNVILPTASAEDVIVMKAFAGRRHDWVDVEGILVKQRGKLDWDYIYRELSLLSELKESPETMDELKRMRERIDAE